MFGGIRTEDQNDGVVPPQATLDDVMTMRELAEDVKVRDVMTRTLICYATDTKSDAVYGRNTRHS